jgi:hypothetical protein
MLAWWTQNSSRQNQGFLTAATPLFNNLKAFAQATGKADLATLLNDLKSDLVTGVTTLAVSGGNAGAAIAAMSSQVLGQVSQLNRCQKLIVRYVEPTSAHVFKKRLIGVGPGEPVYSFKFSAIGVPAISAGN